MNQLVLRIIWVSLICSVTTVTYSNKHLIKLSGAVSAARTESERACARKQLIGAFKKIQYADNKTLSKIVTAYHHENETLLSKNHGDTLYRAIDTFSETPGFASQIYELLHNADNESFVKGHLYEFETALALEKKGESVSHFNYDFICPNRQCTAKIDLATKSHFIECKNIRWESYKVNNSSRAKKIKAQLLSYQEMVNDLDQKEERPSFKLYSKTEITPEWKKWLDKNNIEYEETD